MITLKEHIQTGRALSAAINGLGKAHVAAGAAYRVKDTDKFFRIAEHLNLARSDCEDILFAEHTDFVKIDDHTDAALAVYYGRGDYSAPTVPDVLELMAHTQNMLKRHRAEYRGCIRWASAHKHIVKAIQQVEAFTTKRPTMPFRKSANEAIRQRVASVFGAAGERPCRAPHPQLYDMGMGREARTRTT